ncbi:protein ninF [Escherichia coli]|nr:protein ninF [Escherichia coli]EJQ3847230.1 protein ninF [Escherichia coli]
MIWQPEFTDKILSRKPGAVQSLQYQKESVERALTCANCGQKLHVLEVHVCSDCCAELMSDPNSSMYEEEDDE